MILPGSTPWVCPGWICSRIQPWKELLLPWTDSSQVPPLVDPPQVPPLVEPPQVPPLVEPPQVPPLVDPPQVPPLLEPSQVPPLDGSAPDSAPGSAPLSPVHLRVEDSGLELLEVERDPLPHHALERVRAVRVGVTPPGVERLRAQQRVAIVTVLVVTPF